MHRARGQILIRFRQATVGETAAQIVEPHQHGAPRRLADMALNPEHGGECVKGAHRAQHQLAQFFAGSVGGKLQIVLEPGGGMPVVALPSLNWPLSSVAAIIAARSVLNSSGVVVIIVSRVPGMAQRNSQQF